MARVFALLDANVLFDAAIRDLILEVAEAGLVEVRWTEAIEEETKQALQRQKDMSEPQWIRLRAKMRAAAVDPLVRGFEALIDTLRLPDPDDRHVLAAAIHAALDHIVTYNLADFPSSVTDAFDVVTITPDQLMMAAVVADPSTVLHAAQRIQKRLRKPAVSFADYLRQLEKRGLVTTVQTLRGLARTESD